MKLFKTFASVLMFMLFTTISTAAPTAVETTVIGPFVGEGATLHPDNLSPHKIKYYGTDLGWTYEHDGKIHFLFGDTMSIEASDTPIEASTGPEYDDSFGTVDLKQWSDPGKFSPDNIPLIKLGQNAGSEEASAINPSHALGLFKTPLGGFSNGKDEYGVFFASKPLGCRNDADCVNGLTCDTELGYIGEKYTNEDELTLACIEGSSPFCFADTMFDENDQPIQGTGICSDQTSTIWGETGSGRTNSIGYKTLIGIRSKDDPRHYTQIKEWYTNKFMNLFVRTVEGFDPSNGAGYTNQDYQLAKSAGKNQRVLLWGRPGFVAVGKKGWTLGLYFAYVDLPQGKDFVWDVNYFTGVDKNGVPQFSKNEVDAVPVDMDSTKAGVQGEQYDLVNQNSYAWVEHLKKWVMFFGGGVTDLPRPFAPNCGLIELFAGPDCKDVVIGNGAFRMRTADDPWGPWSPAQDLIEGSDPDTGSGQFGVGGMLYHPSCQEEGCAPPTDTASFDNNKEYGYFYAPTIIESWTRPVGEGVDIIWNASTWDPYRVILLRTRINP